MALPKLCALCVLLLQFQGLCAIQMFIGKNAKSHPAASLLQSSRLQELINPNRGQNTVPTNNNNRIIEIKRQHNVGSNCVTNIPPAVPQSCQPLSTAQPSVTVFKSNTNGIGNIQNPTSNILQLAAPASAPLYIGASSINKISDQQLKPQMGLQNIPVSFIESKNQVPTNSPVTLTFATSQPQPKLTIQSQPQPIPNCPPTQSNVPVHISIESTGTPRHPQCTCGGSNAIALSQPQKTAYVVVNQTPHQPQQQQAVLPLQQQTPKPYVPSQNQNQHSITEQQFPKTPYQNNGQLITPPAPNQAGKPSNLKMLLPLIYNLLKERSANCGCQSNCNCCNMCDPNYNSYGGYIKVTPDGPVFNVEEENDPTVFPGVIRERNFNDSEEDSASEEDESNEIDY